MQLFFLDRFQNTDGDVVDWLTPGTALKKGTRNVEHVRRAGALVDKGVPQRRQKLRTAPVSFSSKRWISLSPAAMRKRLRQMPT